MNKLMRRAPMIVAAVFLLVQVWGLAEYSAAKFDNSSVRGWFFALALETAIFVAWYWTRQNVTVDGEKDKLTKNQKKDINTRLASIAAAVLFMIASAILNTLKAVGDTVPSPTGQYVGAVIYGIAPTLFASVLGYLQGNIDRLPLVAKPAPQSALRMRVYALVENWFSLVERHTSAAMQPKMQADAPESGHAAKRCEKCKQTMRGNAGSHWVWDCPKNPNRRQRKAKGSAK